MVCVFHGGGFLCFSSTLFGYVTSFLPPYVQDYFMNCHVKEDGNVEEDVGEDQDDRRPSNFILNCRVSYEVGEE